MYDPPNYSETGESNSRMAGGGDSFSPALLRSHSSLSNVSAGGSNVHRELYNDLVQMVPLVQSLIDRGGKSSFTRTASMVYTKKPSRESLCRKIVDPKSRNATQSIPVKKRKDKTDKERAKNGGVDQAEMSDNLFASSRTSFMNPGEELIALREQVVDLQNKLFEKDELLKSAENSKTQTASVCAELEEMKLKAAEKDSLYKSTQSQLSDVKIKLADNQAAVEKLQWEAITSNKKVEKLQDDLNSVQGDISSYMSLLEGMAKNTRIMSLEDYDIMPCHLPHPDDCDGMALQSMEEARLRYIAAVDFAKEKKDEDSIAAAAKARSNLHSLVSK